MYIAQIARRQRFWWARNRQHLHGVSVIVITINIKDNTQRKWHFLRDDFVGVKNYHTRIEVKILLKLVQNEWKIDLVHHWRISLKTYTVCALCKMFASRREIIHSVCFQRLPYIRPRWIKNILSEYYFYTHKTLSIKDSSYIFRNHLEMLTAFNYGL